MEINICSEHVKTKNGIKTDKRLIKTKKAIISSLIELLSVKDLSQITVTELTERAKINRKTFYLHYDKIDDCITDFSDDLFNYAQTVLRENIKPDSTDIRPLFSAINHAITDNLEFFRVFIRSGAYHVFVSSAMRRSYLNGLRVSFSQYLKGSVIGLYAVEYMVSGVCSMYRVWLETELPTVSLDTVSEYACAFVSSNLAFFVGESHGNKQ